MAQKLLVFMVEDDERALLHFLDRYHLEVYPRRVPPDWKPFLAGPSALSKLPPESYLAASELGPVLVDKVKRGPDKNSWRVDEVRSPVIFFERSAMNEEGELLAGQFWAELDVTQQTGRRDAAPDRFRRLFVELQEWVTKTFRKGIPKGYLVGPAAARLHKEGLVLREPFHKGGTVTVHR